MQWVGATSELLGPLVQALSRYVLSAGNVNGDDTPVKVLAPGTGKTKKGYLWTYVRDGRPWKSRDPPAVWYQYSPGRAGAYPQRHLKSYAGMLQVDGYAGFEALFAAPAPNVPARITEVGCWAHYPESAVIRSGVRERRDVLCRNGMCLRIRTRCHPCRLSSVELRDDHAFRGLHEMCDAAATVPSVSVARCQARLAR
jgi:hypothetical protein